MNFKNLLISFSELLPRLNTKIIVFYSPELGLFPKAIIYKIDYEPTNDECYIVVNTNELENTWTYLNIKNLINEK